jgi:thiol-disulfide isomerase/thioredoxin
MTTTLPLPSPPAPVAHRRTGRRIVLWVSLSVAVVVAVLVAILASAGPATQQKGSSPLLGQPAPALSGPGLAGSSYDLSQFRGKWVLVNFMATWCAACIQEMPQLQQFAAAHAAKGDAVILTVAEDPTDVGNLRNYLRSHHAGWPAVNDPSAQVAWGIRSMPSSFLVAPEGTVYGYVPGEVTAPALDQLIQDGAAAGLGAA